jgi:hypothetical protein
VRLQGKVGIVVGAGQTPGDTIGNGRAAAVLFAREGAYAPGLTAYKLSKIGMNMLGQQLARTDRLDSSRP